MQEKCPITRVYAYEQPVKGGAFPGGVVEEGENQSKNILSGGQSNYLVYMLSNQKDVVIPTVLWIKGRGHEVRMDTITTLPVRLTNSGRTIQLVPSTSKRVISLSPGPVLNFFAPPPPELQALLDKNDMVIEYRWKKETCYFPVDKIKLLETVAAE